MAGILFRSTIAAIFLTAGSAAPKTTARSRSSPTQYSALVVFGDSFSDNGNVFAYTNHSWPADPAYYKGRFSNGPVWPEHLAAKLSIPLHDLAHGGATTSNALVQGYTGANGKTPVPSLEDQVNTYLSSPPPADAPISNSLFVLFGGNNDILFDTNVTAVQTAGVISTLATRLRDAGAANIVLVGMPNLSMIPYDSYVNGLTRQALRDFSDGLARQLALVAQTSASVKHVSLIPLFHSFEFYEQGWKDPGFDQFGLYGSCLVGAYAEAPRSLCSDPDKHVFWDEYHPSRKTHALVADVIRKAV